MHGKIKSHLEASTIKRNAGVASMLRWPLIVLMATAALGYLGLQKTSSGLQFDGGQAFQHLKRQVSFGPRVPGTLSHQKARFYIGEELRRRVDVLKYQDFPWQVDGKKLRLTNIVGVINPSARPLIAVGAHWDTRPTADMDPDPAKRKTPILGANDGASGVAVVLELARVLNERRPKVGVVFVLFDGEDYGPDVDRMFIGSDYYARNPVPSRPNRVIVVDMVGDADLQIYKEINSLRSDRELVDRIWNTASSLGYFQFVPYAKHTIIDDHVSFHNQGIPAIDIIDFDYPPWHTLGDTVDKCSPRSLEAVGRTLEKYLMDVR
ncbi:MAG: M28 family peptidase [Armatimonadota bacterium]